MSDFKLEFLADKVHAHRWPQESPEWSDDIQNQIDKSLKQNPQKKKVQIHKTTIQIENLHFSNLKKIGISIPFFKDECRIIFESQFDDLFAHIHITIKSDHVNIFKSLLDWKNEFFPKS